jgi:hypothetical protein
VFYEIQRYEAKPSIFRSDKTRTANVLNCFKNNRSSKFSKNTLCKSRKSKLKFVNEGKSLSHIKYDTPMIFWGFSS